MCIRSVRVRVYCVMFSCRDLNVPVAIGGYSFWLRIIKHSKQRTETLKEHFREKKKKDLHLETCLQQVECVTSSLTNTLGHLLTAPKALWLFMSCAIKEPLSLARPASLLHPIVSFSGENVSVSYIALPTF